jgi:hypothetical protein
MLRATAGGDRSKGSVLTNTSLRDVHAPARFIEGEVHWQMAAGPAAVDVSITATALHLFGPRPLPAYLDVFEQHRPVLCELAALKFTADQDERARVRLEREDIEPLLAPAADRRPSEGP